LRWPVHVSNGMRAKGGQKIKSCIGRESNPGLAESSESEYNLEWQRPILPLNHQCDSHVPNASYIYLSSNRPDKEVAITDTPTCIQQSVATIAPQPLSPQECQDWPLTNYGPASVLAGIPQHFSKHLQECHAPEEHHNVSMRLPTDERTLPKSNSKADL
jgi:hypothetical protein